MASDFVHLHVHTDYSMLDGACKISRLAETVQELDMDSVAITDHGNMHGAFEFYNTMKKTDIKPILGCEFYCAPGSRFDKTHTSHPKHKGYHLILFAKDNEGYTNLCRLNMAAHMEGHYYNPRIDWEILEQNSSGIVAATACIGSEVNYHLMNNDVRQAREVVDHFVQVFGKDNFFLELQDHGIPEETTCNRGLIEFSKEFGLPLIATNDAHYLKREHAKAHEALLCIGTGKTLDDEQRLTFSSDNFYIKSPAEMAELFKEVPEAVTNTRMVREMCHVEMDMETSHYPVFDPPGGVDRQDYIVDLCKKGLVNRYDINLDSLDMSNPTDFEKEVIDRMNYELGVIEQMGYTSYFLVVWDFINHARSQGIPVGPGRGSGAGSLVAYLLGITDIEPLRFNLLFERFLNPERCSPPDFDIDFCERRRGEVVEFVRGKYGDDRVAQICTYGTLKAKQVLKDIVRVTGRSFDDGNRLSKMVPDGPKVKLKDVLELPDMRNAMSAEPWIREVVEYAKPLEGLNRQLGIHACGVIIGDQPLTNVVPLARGANGEQLTQFDAPSCEILGLLKMDFLGLKTLTIIQDGCNFVKANKGVEIDPSKIPLDDPKTFELLSRGDTVCVFQLESGGMQNLCRRTKVESVEEVIALIALYRPGPMQFIDDFLDRKFGRVKVEYDHPAMEEILNETYGIMVYQEQVMQVVQKVAGFTLGGADILRRAMGKKKADVMAAQLEKFIEGCIKHSGLTKEQAKAIWDKIETFAGYGFNKSHSAAYAMLSMRTAYLRANYPIEFMCANLCAEVGNSERISELTAECKKMGINVLPPDVNSSRESFTVDGDTIRFGLAAIKGSGEIAAHAIIESREKDGPFTSLEDFCERIGNAANKRLLESLTMTGAFDSFGLKRSQMFAMLDDIIKRAQDTIKDRESGQANFFDLMTGEDENDGSGLTVAIPNIDEWPKQELLQKEKDLLGFYVTGHPLDDYVEQMETFGVHSIGAAIKLSNNRGTRVGGMLSIVSNKISKKDGRPWAILTIEDLDSSMECLCFSDSYAECMDHLYVGAKVLIEGHISVREGDDRPTIMVTKVVPFEEASSVYAREIHLGLAEATVKPEDFEHIKSILKQNPGNVPVVLALKLDSGRFAFVEAGYEYRINPTAELERELRRFCHEGHLKVKAHKKVEDRPERRWEGRAAT